MRVNYSYFIVLLVWNVGFSQNNIMVSPNKLITVFFSEPIILATVGSEDFFLEYNKDGTDALLFIKASSAAQESNLIVKTKDNYFYNINLVPTKTTTLNSIEITKESGILLSPKTALKKEEILVESKKDSIKNYKESIRENDYTIGNTVINDAEKKESNCTFCTKLLEKGKKIKRITSNNYDIKLILESVYYSSGKLYVIVNISNNSAIDFYINYIKTYVQQGKAGSTSSAQYLELNPVEIFNSNRTIAARKSNKMIFIYNQFTIDNNKNLAFELNEANGERNQSLLIPNYIINNPLNFK